MTHQEARTSNAVVKVLVSTSGYTAHALFYSGAMHSFLSSMFAYKLNQPSESLGLQLIISSPVGTMKITRTRYRGCEAIIGGIRSLIDLIKLEEIEFDVILGMDWLSACCAHVDCGGKRIIFKMEGILEFIFEGMKSDQTIPIISALKATKLISQRCRGSLVSVIDIQRSDVKIEGILVVSEYSDVFPEDSLGLP